MKILLTGATGFIGSHILTDLFNKYGPESVVVLSSTDISNISCVTYKSIKNFEIEKNFFDDITHIIHAGAFIPKDVQQANNLEACFSNIEYTKNLLSYNFKELSRILNISTIDVYTTTNDKLSEKSTVNPISLYGSSKLYCEEMVKKFSEKNQNDYINLRIGHVYGPGEEKYKKVLPIAIQNIINNKPLELWGDGSDLRSFIFINDVIESIMNAITLPETNLNINIVSGQVISILEMLHKVVSVSGKNVKINRKESNHVKRDVVFNNHLLLNTVLKKETDLSHGLKVEYEYMKRKYENNI